MHAITLSGHGGPEVMQWSEVPDPRPRAGEVVIEVAATAVNRADLMQRQGFYPPPPGASEILGLECSGRIAELGDGVSRWEVGQPVCALLSGGGYAERVAVPATQLMSVPAGLDLHVAASLPEIACTVWSNLVMEAGLTAGQVLLVHGGGGGIGTHAIQVAAALGARVACTTGSDEKLALCRELGASIAIDYRNQDFVGMIRAATADSPRHGADVILDNMGAKYLDSNIAALAEDGRLVIIGMQGGRKAELDIGKLLAKRGRIIATGLRGRPATGRSSKAEIVRAVEENLWPLIDDGKVQPIIHCELPVTDAAEAHRMLEAGDSTGKIVLRVK